METVMLKQLDMLDIFEKYIGKLGIEDAERCSNRLYAMLPDKNNLNNNGVFVAYGGGKDSSYMIAFVRLVQIIIFKKHGHTFRLRVATNRHTGMPKAVMENIDSVYKALSLYDDPNVETLIIDGTTVKEFDKNLPLPAEIIEQNRTDILMTGHRCNGDARPTFCNACNLSMVNSFGVALSYGDVINIVITGDSKEEQKAYGLWIKRLLNKFGLKYPKYRGFKSFLSAVNEISKFYFKDIHGKENQLEIEKRQIKYKGISQPPMFFSIYEDTSYKAGDHWELLVDYLGFKFDDLAFSFTESDCVNPAIMAHLRGLKVEYLYGRSYKEGIEEYVEFTTKLMKQKEFPEDLIQLAQSRYGNSEKIKQMRKKIGQYTEEALGIREEQLICMVFAPFAGEGENLEVYLRNRQPWLLPQICEIHKLLANPEVEFSNKNLLISYLEDLSGLTFEQLHTLYKLELSTSNRLSPISTILEDDIHKEVIKTRTKENGPVVEELISGR
ncbi:hypothetical protein [Scopulibacillus cellulosilyticus]|uniref:PqqD family protein n=1 Tax=Scopulibacillus cellulosilyticus TaxID=2665665 RepID=A0ABW2PY46_9BACL